MKGKKKRKKVIGWVNVIGFADENNFNLTSAKVYTSEKDALNDIVDPHYIDTIKIKVNVDKLK